MDCVRSIARLGMLVALAWQLAACEPGPLPDAASQALAQAPRLRSGEVAGLRYLELIKGATSEREALPMVVFIHGRGDRAHPGWVDGLSLRARFVFPEAPLPFGDGFSWFAFSARDADTELLARDIAEAASRLAHALGELARTRPTLGKPVVAGFSQGGMLSFALALRHPEQVSFALPISGMLPDPLWQPLARGSATYPPIRALHGSADQVVAHAPTERMVRALRERGFDIELRTYPGVQHDITREMRGHMHALVRQAVSRVATRPLR